MKKNSVLSAVTLCTIFVLGLSIVSQAQLRDQQTRSTDLMGPIVKENPSEGANFSNLFNMQMSHSYSMNFASWGGQFQNMNAYTNTMQFFFSEDLTGRVDLQVLHSPFGNSFMPNNNSGMDMKFLIRNAELNYQINDKSNISIHFQQVPSYGMNPWSSGLYRNSYNSPFNDRIFE
ncbi:hypothetical protein [Fodinibius halophilus]|uniref:Uncharacterized protein n=1 Tax=Fodinibius halophilus TaxID=1736908 RepID=A0A6M1TE31_9BACT|nr:hypothetical protein [Fodinibius halophilus]NGP89024.1 hypothetical protein [Fodinibius halophilus]